MQQHPIPQNVTAYEFHLIGNMTVKQFIELGGGLLLAFIFYSTNIPDIFKWPLVLFSSIMGAAVAFLPFDGRPLDRMVVVFVRAVYSPTQYIWRKTPRLPKYFNYQPNPFKPNQFDAERQRLRKNLNEYLETLPDQPEPDPLDVSEAKQLYDITRLFDQVAPAVNVVPGTSTVSPPQYPKVRVRRMKPEAELRVDPHRVAFTAKAASIQIPEIKPVHVPVAPRPELSLISPDTAPNLSQPQADNGNQVPSTPTSTTQAVQNQSLPFPSLPDEPNLIVGMVLDFQGKIVEDAIIEIRDDHNMPLRALKSNRLGQFFSATPLKNGRYQVEVEKDGLKFSIASLELSGAIIPPLEIRAQAPLN